MFFSSTGRAIKSVLYVVFIKKNSNFFVEFLLANFVIFVTSKKRKPPSIGPASHRIAFYRPVEIKVIYFVTDAEIKLEIIISVPFVVIQLK